MLETTRVFEPHARQFPKTKNIASDRSETGTNWPAECERIAANYVPFESEQIH